MQESHLKSNQIIYYGGVRDRLQEETCGERTI